MHVHTWVCSHSSSPTHAAVVLIKQASPPHKHLLTYATSEETLPLPPHTFTSSPAVCHWKDGGWWHFVSWTKLGDVAVSHPRQWITHLHTTISAHTHTIMNTGQVQCGLCIHIVLYPACMRLPVRNSLMNEVEFLSWAYYPKQVMTNENARLVIIT